MKRFLYLILALLTCWTAVSAQTPKWVGKARKAIISIVTYDKDNKIMNTGNGFFVKTDGTAVADYSLFEGAQRAVIINSDGKEFPVDCILGANSMYDLVKFRGQTDKEAAPSSCCRMPRRRRTPSDAERWTPSPKWRANIPTTHSTCRLATSR